MFLKLKAVYPHVITGANKMICYIKKQLMENPMKDFEARNLSARFTCDMSSSCILGLDAKSFESENPEIFVLGEF